MGGWGPSYPDPFLPLRRWLSLGPVLGLELGGCETYLGSCLTSLLSVGGFCDTPSLSLALCELSLKTEWSMGKVPPGVNWSDSILRFLPPLRGLRVGIQFFMKCEILSIAFSPLMLKMSIRFSEKSSRAGNTVNLKTAGKEGAGGEEERPCP